MQETILIAIKRHDQIKEIIPRLKDAVRAGTRVVFLLRYQVTSLQLCCLSYVDGLRPGASALLAARYSVLEAQAQSHEERISVACETLSRQGIEATVHFYTGSLRKAIKKYTAREDVQLIIMGNGGGAGSVRFLGRFLPRFRFSKRRHIPPALLCRSDMAA